MIRKKWALLTLSGVSLFIAGCNDGENIEEMDTATSELDRLQTESIDSLNQIVSLEDDLQAQFDDTLETDEDLTTLGDGSASVFENIESRENLLTQLSENEAELDEHKEVLETYEGELLNQDEINSVSDNVDTFTDHLSDYRSDYSEMLENQDAYFTNISTDEATYEDFVEGINTVNEERNTVREALLDIDTSLVELDESLTALQSSIDDVLSEEE